MPQIQDTSAQDRPIVQKGPRRSTVLVLGFVGPVLLPAREQRFVTLGNEKAVLRLFRGFQDNLEFYMRIDGQIVLLSGGSALQAGVFHHVAGTYDGSAMKLFVDGVRVAERSVEGTVQTTGNTAATSRRRTYLPATAAYQIGQNKTRRSHLIRYPTNHGRRFCAF